TGAPLITLTLKRNTGYSQSGAAEDASPYAGTVLQPAELAAAVGPAHPAATTASPVTTPAATTPKVATPVKQTTAAKPTTWPQNRPPAFTVPGARKEPLDEMPLTSRAEL